MREIKPTQKPVPSSDVKDLFFNSGKADEFATSFSHHYVDRFGETHFTAEGLRWLAQRSISELGYISVDSFEDGANLPNNELTLPNQALRWKKDGYYYRWDGVYPKVVPVNSTPESTGGFGEGKWMSIGRQKFTMDLEYFVNSSQSYVDALDRAIEYANEGNVVTSGNIGKIKLDRLPSVGLKSNAKLIFEDLIIETNIESSLKGLSIFHGSGSVDTSVHADLLVDVEEYQTIYSVTDASNFSIGDFVSAKYTTQQDKKLIPTNNFSNDFNLYEFTAKIIAINGNDITLDVCRSYKVFANPPAGGYFRIYKCNPIENVEISGVTVIDKNNSESASHSVVALYFSANHKIENIRGENMKGTVAYFENCYGHISNYTTNIRPRSTEAGRGYTEQHLACSNGISSAPYSESGRHCVDHAAGSTGMVVFRGKGKSVKDGIFGCHGSYENNITYAECEADSSPLSPMFYLATSGEVFGNHCKDIKIISPVGRGLGALLYSAAAESRTQGVSIVNPDYRDHRGSNLAVRCNMSETSISGGYIDGGIQVAAIFAPNDYRTDLIIKGTVITPNKDGVFLQTGDVFGNKIVFDNCDTAGMIVLTSNNVNIEFIKGKYAYTRPTSIHPLSVTQRMSSMKLSDVDVYASEGVSVNDKVTGNTITNESVRYHFSDFGKIEYDCVTGGDINIRNTKGNAEITARRLTNLDFNTNAISRKLSVIQSPNSTLKITGNSLSGGGDSLCLDIKSTEQAGITLILTANVHSDKANFGDGSPNVITKGTATGNAYTGSGTQTIAPAISKAANYGYS